MEWRISKSLNSALEAIPDSNDKQYKMSSLITGGALFVGYQRVLATSTAAASVALYLVVLNLGCPVMLMQPEDRTPRRYEFRQE